MSANILLLRGVSELCGDGRLRLCCSRRSEDDCDCANGSLTETLLVRRGTRNLLRRVARSEARRATSTASSALTGTESEGQFVDRTETASLTTEGGDGRWLNPCLLAASRHSEPSKRSLGEAVTMDHSMTF